MKKFFSIAIMLMAVVAAGAQTDFRHISLDEAAKAAKAEGKLIFIDVYTSWCGPCKMMANQTFPQKLVGDYIVAGKNFGCGSSREHAPVVLKVKGIKCIVADSFARIFYRNAINIGLPVLEIGKDVEKIEAGDTIDVDMAKGEITIVNKNIVIKTKPLPEFIQKIADCGGLINYVKGENK